MKLFKFCSVVPSIFGLSRMHNAGLQLPLTNVRTPVQNATDAATFPLILHGPGVIWLVSCGDGEHKDVVGSSIKHAKRW
jgi:hypothetical protein